MKRFIGPLLLVILIAGVAAGIFFSVRSQIAARNIVTVHGLIGSEKEEFFLDARVIQALERGGLRVEIEKAGSRQIATSYDLKQYDFVFPAGIPAAEKIRREQNISKSYDVFYSPMVIASWEPIAKIMVANGVAQDQGGYYTLDFDKYMELVAAGTRWKDLQGNSAYPVNKSILISSTDVRKSNSAAMYLALASYVANGDAVVENQAQAATIMPLMEELFLKQGYTESSSEAPFENYLVMGMGKAPLVMIYESQFLYQASTTEGLQPGMTLIYPQPTIFTKHVLIPITEGGQKLGELLLNDPTLKQLEVEFGFRNTDVAYFNQFVSKLSLKSPEVLVDVVEPPSYEILESMIQQIEQKYK
jgi:hypothetical protein